MTAVWHSRSARRCSLHLRKPQRPLNRLVPRLLAQRIEKGVHLQLNQPSVAQPHRMFEPLECFGPGPPLRVNLGVSIWTRFLIATR